MADQGPFDDLLFPQRDFQTTPTPAPAQPATANDPGPNSGARIFTAAGGTISAVSSVMAGLDNQRVAQANAKVKQLEASMALRDGQVAANQALMRGRAVAAKATAAQAAGGTVGGTGQMTAAQDENVGALDAAMIQRNAARQAMGLQISAGNEHLAGVMARTQGITGAETTALDTGAQEWLEGDPNYGGMRGRGLAFPGR